MFLQGRCKPDSIRDFSIRVFLLSGVMLMVWWLLQGGQAVEAAVPGAGVQDYAAVAAASGVNPSEPVSMHPGLAEAYQLPVSSHDSLQKLCCRLCW